MPPSRQFRAITLVILLTILVLYYVTNGQRLTHDNEFYKKTVAAMDRKKSAAERQSVIEEEKARTERVEKLKKEHDAAMMTATVSIASEETEDVVVAPVGGKKQKPIVQQEGGAEKSVAGRKKKGDGKVVDDKPASDTDDGVAKVGNVEPKSSKAVAQGEGEDDDEAAEKQREVELELNSILKKGPIIIFSKTYCPYSKKAKHILLDLYTISPPPYVVELDEHALGSGLQEALQKSTGRRTVPNVLINGKSIGGGDDVQALHDEEKLIETVKSMGGKRVVDVKRKSAEERDKIERDRANERAKEVKFKA